LLSITRSHEHLKESGIKPFCRHVESSKKEWVWQLDSALPELIPQAVGHLPTSVPPENKSQYQGGSCGSMVDSSEQKQQKMQQKS
jgi:hypothetical protein